MGGVKRTHRDHGFAQPGIRPEGESTVVEAAARFNWIDDSALGFDHRRSRAGGGWWKDRGMARGTLRFWSGVPDNVEDHSVAGGVCGHGPRVRADLLLRS